VTNRFQNCPISIKHSCPRFLCTTQYY